MAKMQKITPRIRMAIHACMKDLNATAMDMDELFGLGITSTSAYLRGATKSVQHKTWEKMETVLRPYLSKNDDLEGLLPAEEEQPKVRFEITPSSEKKPYCCPVCSGVGYISRPHDIPGDVHTWTVTENKMYKCRACENGILWR